MLNYQGKQLERTQILCLFPQDLKNVSHNFEDHVSNGMTKEEFRNLYKTSSNNDHGFVVIDLASKKHSRKYRSGLDTCYIPN